MDLSGLNPDMASLKRHVASFRPLLQKTLREKHGIEVLAIYTYPAQILFCKKPLASLRELEKRRIRVSSPSQADLIQGLGGVPVLVGFGQMLAHLQSGNTECAITGTMSGNTNVNQTTNNLGSTNSNANNAANSNVNDSPNTMVVQGGAASAAVTGSPSGPR